MITKCIQEFNLLPCSSNDLRNIAADWLEEQSYQFESLIIRTNSYIFEKEDYTSAAGGYEYADDSVNGVGQGDNTGYGGGRGGSSGYSDGNGDGCGVWW